MPSAVEWAMAPEKSSTAMPSSETRSAQNTKDGCGAEKSRPADVPPTIATPSGSARTIASRLRCGSTPKPSTSTMHSFGSRSVAPMAWLAAERQAASTSIPRPLPIPAVMSTLSDAKSASVIESSL